MQNANGGTSSTDARERLCEAVRTLLERLETPATALQISKLLGPSRPATLAELRVALALLVEQRRVHAWGQRFTLHDPERIILEALRAGPLTQAELARALNSIAPRLATTAELRRALRKLCRNGVVREHPKVGKAAQRYGLEPPALEPFVRPVGKTLRNVSKRLERAGVTLTDLLVCLVRDLGEQQRVAQRIAGATAAREEARVRIKTDPGVPLAIREHRTRRRKQTLPDSPGALREIVATDESIVLSTFRNAAPGFSMTLAELKRASGLSDGRFARAVLALSDTGQLAIAGVDGKRPSQRELEDQAELETARASLPPDVTEA